MSGLNQESELEVLLTSFRDGETSLEETIAGLKNSLTRTENATTIDHDRERRTGAAEVIYAEFKTPDQVVTAFDTIRQNGNNVLATRVQPEAHQLLKTAIPEVTYSEEASLAYLIQKDRITPKTSIGVVTAGTSDQSVAEEAALTAEFYGNKVERIQDVGVAGIHRLLSRVDVIRKCRVLIVVAGMEGALPSVVGGLVDKPVIAVPTSVGYGAAFEGVAALLGMLTSCASGVSVVNIDNGFGAGFLANLINRLE